MKNEKQIVTVPLADATEEDFGRAEDFLRKRIAEYEQKLSELERRQQDIIAAKNLVRKYIAEDKQDLSALGCARDQLRAIFLDHPDIDADSTVAQVQEVLRKLRRPAN